MTKKTIEVKDRHNSHIIEVVNSKGEIVWRITVYDDDRELIINSPERSLNLRPIAGNEIGLDNSMDN